PQERCLPKNSPLLVETRRLSLSAGCSWCPTAVVTGARIAAAPAVVLSDPLRSSVIQRVAGALHRASCWNPVVTHHHPHSLAESFARPTKETREVSPVDCFAVSDF